MKKTTIGKQRKICMFKTIGMLFLFLIGQAASIHSLQNESCHILLVQIPDRIIPDNASLSEEELTLAGALAEQLSNMDIAAIYSSDEHSALQTADLIAQYHLVPVIPSEALRLTLPYLHFRRAGSLRTFIMNLLEKNLGDNVVIVTHQDLVTFVGRYTNGGFKPIPHFSYLEFNSDGKSMYLRP